MLKKELNKELNKVTHVTWQFFGGIDTIGGTIILMETETHRLIFDMGRIFNPGAPIFDAHIQPRDIRDLQKMGLAPYIPGLFQGDGTEVDPRVQTLVAVSHSHLDHIGLLPFLREDIPVLLSNDTHHLIKALDDALDGPRKPLQYIAADPHSTITFGPFRITVIPVDHDTPGARAFFIQVGDLRFVYSGDLRLHGSHPVTTRHFAQLAHDFQPDVLWIEGTRALSDDNASIYSENELADHISEAIQNSSAGVYFSFYPRHPQRVNAFAEAAKRTGRTLLLDGASAYIYKQFGGDIDDIAIYGGNHAQWTDRVLHWIREENLPVVYPNDIRGKEHRWIIELLYQRLIDWIDIDAQPGGLYIHSNGAPLGPYDPTWNNLMEWIRTLDMQFASIGSTGHGSRGDIHELIETIHPRVLMPIHSLQPELIGVPSIPRLMPQYGRTYTSDDLLKVI